MSEQQCILEQIMTLQNVVPSDGYAAYNNRQLEIAVLRHKLGILSLSEKRNDLWHVLGQAP